MKLAVALLALSILRALMPGAGGASAVAAQGPVLPASEGVYTRQQATRGQESFGAECASCHPAMNGTGNTAAPSLSGSEFLRRWADRSAGDVLLTMRSTMPPNAPASLSKDTYIDILAYVLSSNGYPPGAVELGSGAVALNGIVLDRKER